MSVTLLTTGENLSRIFSIASRLSRQSDTSYQKSVFLAIIGEEVYDVYNGLKFDCDEDKMDLEIVIKKMHEAYESYKFHLH